MRINGYVEQCNGLGVLNDYGLVLNVFIAGWMILWEKRGKWSAL